GIGGIVGYVTFYICYLYFNKQLNKAFFGKLVTIIIFIFIGMFPYLYTYLTKVNPTPISNPDLYESAFNSRIPELFSNPIEFVKSWNRPVFYFYLAAFLLLFFVDNSKNRRTFKT